MEKIVLHGRKVVGGVVEGEALVTKETISGWELRNPKFWICDYLIAQPFNQGGDTLQENRISVIGNPGSAMIVAYPGVLNAGGMA